MTAEEIFAGESENIEFKSEIPAKSEKYMKTVVAFANGKGGKSKKDDEIDIIAGEDESEDTYPLLENGAFADIEAMIRDTLVESLPLQPLCRPDCRGLCSQCGADLNEDPDHHHDVTDIRFAGLAGLKAQLEAEQNGEQAE